LIHFNLGRKGEEAMGCIVRRAKLTDLEKLVEFTLSEANEAEGLSKNSEMAREGIRAALGDDSVAIYWVLQDSDNEVVGNISVVKEWSNWNAGYYWWIQSLYIKPEHRGRGYMRKLIQTVKESARQYKGLDLRLYVHKNNKRAISAYLRTGFVDSDYRIMTMEI
jgi:ribosomal protein S18 acetylase RimI-like enzyme